MLLLIYQALLLANQWNDDPAQNAKLTQIHIHCRLSCNGEMIISKHVFICFACPVIPPHPPPSFQVRYRNTRHVILIFSYFIHAYCLLYFRLLCTGSYHCARCRGRGVSLTTCLCRRGLEVLFSLSMWGCSVVMSVKPRCRICLTTETWESSSDAHYDPMSDRWTNSIHWYACIC